MYGAILGDIIGSPFEFDRGDKTKNFDLFSEGCGFTDDSVMTIAVGEKWNAVIYGSYGNKNAAGRRSYCSIYHGKSFYVGRTDK